MTNNVSYFLYWLFRDCKDAELSINKDGDKFQMKLVVDGTAVSADTTSETVNELVEKRQLCWVSIMLDGMIEQIARLRGFR